jgi:hypothetical protein
LPFKCNLQRYNPGYRLTVVGHSLGAGTVGLYKFANPVDPWLESA